MRRDGSAVRSRHPVSRRLAAWSPRRSAARTPRPPAGAGLPLVRTTGHSRTRPQRRRVRKLRLRLQQRRLLTRDVASVLAMSFGKDGCRLGRYVAASGAIADRPLASAKERLGAPDAGLSEVLKPRDCRSHTSPSLLRPKRALERPSGPGTPSLKAVSGTDLIGRSGRTSTCSSRASSAHAGCGSVDA